MSAAVRFARSTGRVGLWSATRGPWLRELRERPRRGGPQPQLDPAHRRRVTVFRRRNRPQHRPTALLRAHRGGLPPCARLADLAEIQDRPVAAAASDGTPQGLCAAWAPTTHSPRSRDATLSWHWAPRQPVRHCYGQWFPDATLVHCDRQRGRRAGVPRARCRAHRRRCGGSAGAARRMGSPSSDPRRPQRTWTSTRWREHARDDLGNDPRELDPGQAYRRMDDLLPDNRVVVTDSGRSLPTPRRSSERPTHGPSWWAGGYGSVGLGLETALGAACARPDAHVVLFLNDGHRYVRAGPGRHPVCR